MQTYKASIQTVLVIGCIVAFTVSRAAFAGDRGIIVGSLESGSVVGQPFKKLVIDAELVVVEDREGKVHWYPNVILLSPKRGQRPVFLKLSNQTPSRYTFSLSEDPTFSSPIAIRADVVLDPGESKYMGIPASELTYVSHGSTLTIKSKDGIDGQIKFIFPAIRSQ